MLSLLPALHLAFGSAYTPSLPSWTQAVLPGCAQGEECGRLALANGLTFNCRFAGPAASVTNVLLLHVP